MELILYFSINIGFIGTQTRDLTRMVKKIQFLLRRFLPNGFIRENHRKSIMKRVYLFIKNKPFQRVNKVKSKVERIRKNSEATESILHTNASVSTYLERSILR